MAFGAMFKKELSVEDYGWLFDYVLLGIIGDFWNISDDGLIDIAYGSGLNWFGWLAYLGEQFLFS